jgi:hypothetical protein
MMNLKGWIMKVSWTIIDHNHNMFLAELGNS